MKIYKEIEFQKESEQVEMCMVAELGTDALTTWLQRRWEYYIISMNTCVGLLLALMVTLFSSINPDRTWYIGFSVILGILFINGLIKRSEVMAMDNFLARNFWLIYDRKHSKKE